MSKPLAKSKKSKKASTKATGAAHKERKDEHSDEHRHHHKHHHKQTKKEHHKEHQKEHRKDRVTKAKKDPKPAKKAAWMSDAAAARALSASELRGRKGHSALHALVALGKQPFFFVLSVFCFCF